MGFPQVGTHDGVFHADEVFAVAILKIAYGAIELFRTRDSAILRRLDIVVDVGGEYEPSRLRFDHHQRQGPAPRPSGAPYASAGLVWKTYGGRAVVRVLMDEGLDIRLTETPPLAREVDQYLLEAIDANDVGDLQIDCRSRETGRRSFVTTVSEVVAQMNPPSAKASPEDRDKSFHDAVAFAEGVVRNHILRAAYSHMGRQTVLDAPVVELGNGMKAIRLEEFVPWGKAIWARPDVEELVGVVFPNTAGDWVFQTRSASPNDRVNHVVHGPTLQGLSGEALREKSGVPDAVFVHPNGFTGAAESFEGLIALTLFVETANRGEYR